MLPCSTGQVGVGIDAPANQIVGCSQKQLLSGGGFHHPGHDKTEGQLGYDYILCVLLVGFMFTADEMWKWV